MIEHVRKRGLEAHSYSLGNREDFSEAEADRGRAWPLEDADSGVAEASCTGGSGSECGEIEVLSA